MKTLRAFATLFGLGLALEGLAKQINPKGWMRYLVDYPVAYLPEPVVAATREYRDLSPRALRLLGAMQLMAGAIILTLLCVRRR